MAARPGVDVLASPHVHQGQTTSRMMWLVTLCLLPATAWGVLQFGLPAARTLFAALAASLLAELVVGSLLHRACLWDGSAALTGLLVGLCMPPSVPVYVPVTASVFAIAVAKWAFGGLGANWVNPALAGLLFATLSWRELFSHWEAPRLWGKVDIVSAATPLSLLAGGGAPEAARSLAGAGLAAAPGYAVSAIDAAATAWLDKLLGLHGSLRPGLLDLLVGNRPGAIGELSALLLLLPALVLVGRRIVAWEIPLSFVATVAVLAWVLGGVRSGQGYFHGDVAVHLLGGGLALGALYMATDPVTSPLTRGGMLLFGVGCGGITFLVRAIGVHAEGVAFAIVLMNTLVPLLDRLTTRRGRRPGRG